MLTGYIPDHFCCTYELMDPQCSRSIDELNIKATNRELMGVEPTIIKETFFNMTCGLETRLFKTRQKIAKWFWKWIFRRSENNFEQKHFGNLSLSLSLSWPEFEARPRKMPKWSDHQQMARKTNRKTLEADGTQASILICLESQVTLAHWLDF